MKLSDIKGERALDIVADAMELVELMQDDDRFKALTDDLKALGEDRGDAWKVLCRHLPAIMRDGRYKSRIVSILAAASGVSAEEYAENGQVLSDLAELLASDAETLGFLTGAAITAA